MPAMAAIIEQVPRRVSRGHLFGERSDVGFANWANSKSALDAFSGVSGWTVHDLRRSAATGMANLGVAPHVVEEILNHQSGHRRGVAGIYNRATYGTAVRAALDVWHEHIRALVSGGERKVLILPQNAK
jgi:integrase